MNRCRILHLAGQLGALLALSISLGAQAQSYPEGPITIVIPLAPGDAADTTVRTMAEDISKALKVPVTVANKPGAGGSIGVQAVASAAKDGRTLLFAQNGPLTIRPVLDPKNTHYNTARDLQPLALTTRSPSILVVHKDAPFNTFDEMVAYAKKSPGSVRIGTAGPGSAGDVSVRLINSMTGAQLMSVPYKGGAPAVKDALGGQIEGVILALGAVSGHLKAGGFKPIAISNTSPDWPQVPTLSKLGHPRDILGVWFAFLAPAGVSTEATNKLIPAIQQANQNPLVAERLRARGIQVDWQSGADLGKLIERETATVAELMKATQ